MKKYRFLFHAVFLFSALSLFSCKNDDSFDNSSSSSDQDTSSDTEYGVTYSYYLEANTDQIWAEITGRKGSVLPSVTTPKKDGYRFTKWQTKDGDEPPATFGDSAQKFCAAWEKYDKAKLIGSKTSPDTVGDVIFTDGSASPYPKTYDELTDKQWKAAVAMLFTTTYNPATGSNEKGGQYQYKIAAGLLASSLQQWCTDVLYEMDDDEIGDATEPGPKTGYNYYFKFKDHHFIYNFMYTGYDWDESMDAHAAEQANSLVLGPLALSQYFGRQNYVSSSQFTTLATKDIAPAFDYVIQYGASQNMDNSCRDNWYLPSYGELKVLFTDDEVFQKYNRLVMKKFLAAGSPSGFLERIVPVHVFWTSTTNGVQPYDTSINVATRREHNESYGPTHGKDVGVWGTNDTNTNDRHNRMKVYDPCTGRIIHPMLNKTLVSTNLDVYPNPWPDTEKVDNGYAFSYVLYNKAYQMDVLGNLSFDTKTEAHSVIAMRVFE